MHVMRQERVRLISEVATLTETKVTTDGMAKHLQIRCAFLINSPTQT